MLQEAALLKAVSGEPALWPLPAGVEAVITIPPPWSSWSGWACPRFLNRNVESLSGGQKWVNLARTLSLEPEIILMDEPTSSLDPAATRTIENLILELNRQGRTIILVSHNLEQIGRIATACLVLDQGRKIFDGSPEELFANAEIRDILTRGKEEANG